MRTMTPPRRPEPIVEEDRLVPPPPAPLLWRWNLNLDVDFMKDKLASCENLAIEIWKILAAGMPAITRYGKLHCVRLYETPRNFVDYYGE